MENHKSSQRWLIPLIILVGIGNFALDAYTPLGFAEYVFYFLPVALSLLHRSPTAPVIAATVITLLAIGGYFVSPEGRIADLTAATNRGIALFTIWCIAYMARRIVATRQDVEEQNWLKAGLAELLVHVRGEHKVSRIAELALHQIAEYISARVGAFYLMEEGDQLKRVAGFAFPAGETPSRDIFRLGEGIPGQVAKDRNVLYLENVPPGHLPVTSGVGSSDPDSLLAFPLIVNDELVGVIELGFFGRQSPLLPQFAESISEPLAVAVRSAQDRSRLAQLLHRTQQQAEELQAQQEELRVVNEELEQQTKALKESQVRLENQQAELEQTNQQLEQQTQELERQKKDLEIAQRELEAKADELARSSQYKSEFLANMSHELRTPLNSSLILAKLLSENRGGNLTDEQVKYAQTIHSSGSDLLTLINDILDLSKIESGKMEVHPEAVDTQTLLRSLEQTFLPVARQKGLELRVGTARDAPQALYSDRGRIEQILKNFLSNALKFTEKGEVRLEVFREGDDVQFAVTDTGIGIPENQQGVIFEAFRQADGTTNRKYGGTGLGLSISRELANLLGGSIDLHSKPGEGSTFCLQIPIQYSAQAREETRATPQRETPPASESAAAPAESRGLRTFVHTEPLEAAPARPAFSFEDDRGRTAPSARKVLIIEDDETFANILYDLAHEMKFDALVAATGTEGIELARQHTPQAILLDIRLPDHNGLAVLDQLKSDSRTRHIPVHVLSGEDFAETAYELGAIGYMVKPVLREQLIETFGDLERRASQKFHKVLVVEDNSAQRESIVALIDDPGIRITPVGTAREALDKLASETYDCMIMDLSLPDMSGYDILEKLAAPDAPYGHPPIIVYTGRDLSQEEEARLRKHAGSIIIKGAKSPERLFNEVTLFLHRVESDLPPDRQKILRDLRNREKSFEGRRILLVDDDARNIFALSSVLEPKGARIEIARNGKEALRKLEQIGDIDLILMDIMMPEMDGYEATRRIRKMPEYKDVPIIAVTAKAMRDDQEKCIQAGANDYLPKPIDVDKLLSLVRVWMPVRRSA